MSPSTPRQILSKQEVPLRRQKSLRQQRRPWARLGPAETVDGEGGEAHADSGERRNGASLLRMSRDSLFRLGLYEFWSAPLAGRMRGYSTGTVITVLGRSHDTLQHSAHSAEECPNRWQLKHCEGVGRDDRNKPLL